MNHSLSTDSLTTVFPITSIFPLYLQGRLCSLYAPVMSSLELTDRHSLFKVFSHSLSNCKHKSTFLSNTNVATCHKYMQASIFYFLVFLVFTNHLSIQNKRFTAAGVIGETNQVLHNIYMTEKNVRNSAPSLLHNMRPIGTQQKYKLDMKFSVFLSKERKNFC